jgi:hypothetical protein
MQSPPVNTQPNQPQQQQTTTQTNSGKDWLKKNAMGWAKGKK